MFSGSAGRIRFVDRKPALAALGRWWAARGAQLGIVFGKRRVGKTALLTRWMQGKPAVYYLADRRPERDQLRELAKRLGHHFGDEFVARKGFDDWLEVFAYLNEKPARRLALVIDEFPYLVENNPAVSSLFQKGWDETLHGLPICLVLCGSSTAMMVKETLAQTSPLYGRRTGDLHVRPLEFSAVREFFPRRVGFARSAEVYATLGGMPGYLAHVDARRDLEANVRAEILTPGAPSSSGRSSSSSRRS